MATVQTIEREGRAETAGQEQSLTELTIGGKTCGNCARHVTEALQSVPGVRSVAVNLEGKSASVRWEYGAQQNDETLIHAVEKAGYEAKVDEACRHEQHDHKLVGWQLN